MLLVGDHPLAARLEVLAHLDQQRPDMAQAGHQLGLALDGVVGPSGGAALHGFLGPVERHAALLDQVVDDLEVLHVLRRKKAVALLVALGLQHAELRFPMADERRLDVEHLGQLAHRIKKFFGHGFVRLN